MIKHVYIMIKHVLSSMIKHVYSMIKHVSSMVKHVYIMIKHVSSMIKHVYFAAGIGLYIFLLKITNKITSYNSVHLIWNILYVHAPTWLHSVGLNEELQQFSTAIIILSLRHIQTSLFHFNSLGCTSSTEMKN
jgi:hypothetical protein